MVIDWRAPIASVYYESSLGPCKYTVSSEGTFEIDLNRKRTYGLQRDKLIDFFDSDVVANDELLTKYLAKNKRQCSERLSRQSKGAKPYYPPFAKDEYYCAGELQAQEETTVAMHRISYILYNYADDFRPEDFYIIGSKPHFVELYYKRASELDVYGIKTDDYGSSFYKSFCTRIGTKKLQHT